MGHVHAANLLRAVRPEGVIVKPDAPLTPLDSRLLSDSLSLNAPLVSATYSDFGGLRTYYVFAFSQGPDARANLALSELGLDQPAYVYDYFGGTGRVVKPGEIISQPIVDGRIYLVVAPIGPSGMAVLGDAGQFVGLGKKRVPALADDGVVRLAVAFASGEARRTIYGYSPWKPQASALNGALGFVAYDAATQRFRITVMPGANGTASVQISKSADSGQDAERSRRTPPSKVLPLP